MMSSTNVHKPIIVEGICEGIPAGVTQLTLHAGMCHGHTSSGLCWLGYCSYVHVSVAETYVSREIIQF
ncbi:hypothetical protein EB796_018451 [Bugula neritina]|uniref:CTHRC1 C-terminal domain-containing protein n=1 Tax=Bugula neritina TaxID=10212 RepID=A0A7J7JB88_BUGNE|nr:hypothetical protein EB796_018451 [Bugula neritina]